MAAFSYTALDKDGKQTKGVMDADSARQVRQFLREQSLLALTVDLVSHDKYQPGNFGFSFFKPSLGLSLIHI